MLTVRSARRKCASQHTERDCEGEWADVNGLLCRTLNIRIATIYIQSQRAFDWHFLWYALTGGWTKCVGNASNAVLFWLRHIYVIFSLSLYLHISFFSFYSFRYSMPMRIQYLIIIYCVAFISNQPPNPPAIISLRQNHWNWTGWKYDVMRVPTAAAITRIQWFHSQ